MALGRPVFEYALASKKTKVKRREGKRPGGLPRQPANVTIEQDEGESYRRGSAQLMDRQFDRSPVAIAG